MSSYFRNLYDEGKIEPGLRQDSFLYADSAAIQSSLDHSPLPERGYVLAADASMTLQNCRPTYMASGVQSVLPLREVLLPFTLA